jgi:hypothetical protein
MAQTSTISPLAQLLTTQLEFTHRTLHVNTEGITHEMSLVQPQPGGNCLNWIAGHLVVSRNRILELVGEKAVWDEDTVELYRRRSPGILGDETGILDFDRILEDYDSTQDPILEAIAGMSAAKLTKEAARSSIDTPPAKQLAGLVFHEAYHVGQTGLLRRMLGEKGAIY